MAVGEGLVYTESNAEKNGTFRPDPAPLSWTISSRKNLQINILSRQIDASQPLSPEH